MPSIVYNYLLINFNRRKSITMNLKINSTLVDCVIKGTLEGLQMTGLRPDAVGASRFNKAASDLSVIVGLHGQCNGNMTLNFSENTAVFIAERFMGEEIKTLDENAIDAICEIGNMVAGSFKELLEPTEFRFTGISLPALIFGANYYLYHVKNITTVTVTFEINEVSINHIHDKFFTTSISLLGQSGS
ncbi:MAG: chemotaxis protein CheX [bacterium]